MGELALPEPQRTGYLQSLGQSAPMAADRGGPSKLLYSSGRQGFGVHRGGVDEGRLQRVVQGDAGRHQDRQPERSRLQAVPGTPAAGQLGLLLQEDGRKAPQGTHPSDRTGPREHSQGKYIQFLAFCLIISSPGIVGDRYIHTEFVDSSKWSP